LPAGHETVALLFEELETVVADTDWIPTTAADAVLVAARKTRRASVRRTVRIGRH
jgi:hypothetical protein